MWLFGLCSVKGILAREVSEVKSSPDSACQTISISPIPNTSMSSAQRKEHLFVIHVKCKGGINLE